MSTAHLPADQRHEICGWILLPALLALALCGAGGCIADPSGPSGMVKTSGSAAMRLKDLSDDNEWLAKVEKDPFPQAPAGAKSP
jgi:hypothetical protein